MDPAAADPPAGRRGRVAALAGRAVAAVRIAFDAERERWPLWLPVGMGSGIALYFALPAEPPGAAGVAALLLCAIGVLGGAARSRRGAGQGLLITALALGSAALGFAAAKLAADRAAAPVIAHRTGPVTVTGRVLEVEPGAAGARVTLGAERVGWLAPERTPARVRVRLFGNAGDLRLGDRVRLRAVLLPPPEPVAPGAYDFARDAWFRRLGAVGFAVTRPARLSPPAAAGGLMSAAERGLAEARRAVYARVTAALPGATGGIAAALMTGERGAIPAEAMEAMRVAGLAHLLAISGLHVGLVTGVLFFGIRALLAAWETLALRHPIKKWAAGVSLIGAFGYMLMTGATVPTQRAFLMAALVLAAVMLDRAALSMRLVAWAAALVLLIAPESLTGPSFQMSFAAVVSLIATYEAARGGFARLRRGAGPARRALVYLLGIALTTVVAGMATAPFAVFHFNRFAAFGLVANLGAVPVTALWVMPWAVVAYLLMPLGLESLALEPMGRGIDSVLGIAEAVASWPGAAARVPVVPTAALALVALGGLWLCLWRGRWRFGGVAGIGAGILLAALARPPDILVSGDARTFAVRTPAGGLVLGGSGGREYLREAWLRRAGLPPETAATTPSGMDDGLRCDSLACVVRVRGVTVSVIRDPGAALEDCYRADVVVALAPLRRRCPAAVRVVGRFDLWRDGAHALWIDGPGRVRLVSAAERRGDRPWVRIRRPRGTR